MSEIVKFEDYYAISTAASNSIESLRLPLGVNIAGKLEEITITDKRWQHLLVAGHSGTGKSMYLHTILASLLLNYTAEHLHIWLSDGGMCAFNHFAATAPAHIKRVNCSCAVDEYIAFTDALAAETERRFRVLASAKMTSVYGCYQETGKLPFPRLLVMIDGFDHYIQTLSNAGHDHIVQLDTAVRNAAACGITFVVTTQDVQHIPSRLLDALGIRIATQLSFASYARLFGPVSVSQPHDLTLGEALVNQPSFQKISLLYLNQETEEQILHPAT